MNLKKWYLLSVLGLFLTFSVNAKNSPDSHSPNNSTNNNSINESDEASFRFNCVKPLAQRDQSINNVRARLTTGGDVWWDRADAKYIVPKPVLAGDEEVSSIFAGGVWLGGVQEGNFRVAAQQYGNAGGDTRDFWTGPLNATTDPNLRGTTADSICSDWDRFWVVTGEEIDEHLRNFLVAQETGGAYDPADIPDGVKGWPGKGNPFFFELNNFELPFTDQGLGAFHDEDGDENYDPSKGDYPIIEIEGCTAPQYPDEMFFWIYNDAGNIHTETNGAAIRMEIQVQSFAYATSDALNNMTFQRYKLINRASLPIDSTFFAMWVDADLGCFTDDYIGCDTTRSLAYYYNVDAEDGNVGTNCDGVPTYGTNIPALGIDYFRGPKEPVTIGGVDTLVELGMSSFTYFNNPGQGGPPGPEQDPNTVVEYYNYLSGSWRDGSPYTFGGNGYGGTEPIKFAFPDAPDDPAGWSMCTASDFNSPLYDRRTVQASGPFRLDPGAVNELIVGAVWVPDLDYPCPNLSDLFNADDLAQNLFDACFDIVDGPDAPDVDMIELDREVVLVLTNDEVASNNAREEYQERDIEAPNDPDIDGDYKFQGYKIYQLIDGFVSPSEFNDPDKARLIFQVDLKDGIDQIFNWEALADTPEFISNAVFIANEQVDGNDEGIRHTFVVRNDQFASGFDTRLVNQQQYFFSAVAYGYNNWNNFNPEDGTGQRRPYVQGRKNIRTYVATPRPITDVQLNSVYGDGVQVTRLDGVGNGGNFIDLSDETLDNITSAGTFGNGGRYAEPLVYKDGLGPIDVQIYNPLDVKNGEFKVEILDGGFGDSGDLDQWILTDEANSEVRSEQSIQAVNEQIIGDYGFSLSIGQLPEPGTQVDPSNGAIGFAADFLDTENALPWYIGVPDRGGDLVSEFPFLGQLLNFANPQTLTSDDPAFGLTNIGGGFIPYKLAEHRGTPYFLGNNSPAWQNNSNNLVVSSLDLADLNNVDIVFTSDKSLWSRCIIVETASNNNDVGIPAEGSAGNFDPRDAPSVGKEDANGDGFPDPDGNTERPTGMGWFPGYAIDVETGRRLNIFFGENSRYTCEGTGLPCDLFADGQGTGRDMMFNPSSQFFLPDPGGNDQNLSAFNLMLGGQHYVYVTDQAYDGCAEIYDGLNGSSLAKVEVLQNVTWAGVNISSPDAPFKSYADGLIPSDIVLKLRVNNQYDYEQGVQEEQGTNPTYTFRIDGKQAETLDEAGVESQLDMINVVPNPYYGFSDYEGNNTENIVKITNLPAKCVVTIYSLDGKFIRQYIRDEIGQAPVGSAITSTQIIPSIDWDMKNSKGIPIAGGVYLIHVDADDLGERVLKWFGTNRQFDPGNL